MDHNTSAQSWRMRKIVPDKIHDENICYTLYFETSIVTIVYLFYKISISCNNFIIFFLLIEVQSILFYWIFIIQTYFCKPHGKYSNFLFQYNMTSYWIKVVFCYSIVISIFIYTFRHVCRVFPFKIQTKRIYFYLAASAFPCIPTS